MKALNAFLELMASNPDRAVYGYAHVKRANDEAAIETCMVSDSLFRSNDVAQRRRYVELVEAVRDAGATTLIFSSMHPSGEQLAQFTGVAAILRFPIPEIDREEWGEWNEFEMAASSTAISTDTDQPQETSTSSSSTHNGINNTAIITNAALLQENSDEGDAEDATSGNDFE